MISAFQRDLAIDLVIVCSNLLQCIFDLAFHKPDGFNYDFWRDVFRLKINNVKGEAGAISFEHSWKSE